MVVVDSYRGRRVAVLGLAKSGLAAARSLLAGGAEVCAWDDNPKAREHVAGEFAMLDPAEADWRGVAALVLSPGIPHSFPEPHPAVTRGREAGRRRDYRRRRRDLPRRLRRAAPQPSRTDYPDIGPGRGRRRGLRRLRLAR